MKTTLPSTAQIDAAVRSLPSPISGHVLAYLDELDRRRQSDAATGARVRAVRTADKEQAAQQAIEQCKAALSVQSTAHWVSTVQNSMVRKGAKPLTRQVIVRAFEKYFSVLAQK